MNELKTKKLMRIEEEKKKGKEAAAKKSKVSVPTWLASVG